MKLMDLKLIGKLERKIVSPTASGSECLCITRLLLFLSEPTSAGECLQDDREIRSSNGLIFIDKSSKERYSIPFFYSRNLDFKINYLLGYKDLVTIRY